MSCPRDAADLWHVCSLSWICGKNKKNYMEKNYCNPQCFQGKNYKDKFLTSLILKKIKSTKKILEKKHKEKEKKPCRKTLSNL
jgi:hypothetical protein